MSLRALITGASSGIGFSYAEYLKNEGWYLDLVSKDEKRLQNSKHLVKH